MGKSKFGSIFISILIGKAITFGVTSCTILGSGCSGMTGHEVYSSHSGNSSHSEHNTGSGASEHIEIIKER